MKHLVLVVQLKTDYKTKITETEKKLTDHNQDKYVTTPEFNTWLPMLLTQDQHKQTEYPKHILMLNCQAVTEKLLQIKQNICMLKMN